MTRQHSPAVIINDHALINDLLTPIFKDHGLEVVATFPSLAPGLAYVLAHPPALVVIDMVLPLMRTFKGEEVEDTHPYILQDCVHVFPAVRTIRKKCPHTKILMLSDERHPHTFHRGLQMGAHGIASKIDSLAEMVSMLRRIMAGETRVLSTRMKPLVEAYEAEPIPELTALEVKILELAQEGLENPEIGRKLDYAAKTIRNRFHTINQKLNTRNRYEALEMAIAIGLVGWRTGGNGENEDT